MRWVAGTCGPARGRRNQGRRGESMESVSSAERQLDPKLLLKTLRAFRKGDFTVRMPLDLVGTDGAICEAFNDIVELNQGLARELDRLARVVGKEGQIGERGR